MKIQIFTEYRVTNGNVQKTDRQTVNRNSLATVNITIRESRIRPCICQLRPSCAAVRLTVSDEKAILQKIRTLIQLELATE